MPVNSRIEVAYLFDGPLPVDALTDLFRTLESLGGGPPRGDPYPIAWWDAEGSLRTDHLPIRDLGDVVLSAADSTVRVSFPGFDVELGRSSEQGRLSSMPHLLLSTAVSPFESGDASLSVVDRRRERWLNVLARTAESLEPAIAYGGRGEERIVADVPLEDPSSDRPAVLWDYNVYSESLVSDIGRDRMEKTPAYHVESLSTGAVFLVVRAPPQSCGPTVEACTAVADHLGIPVS